MQSFLISMKQSDMMPRRVVPSLQPTYSIKLGCACAVAVVKNIPLRSIASLVPHHIYSTFRLVAPIDRIL